MRLRGDADERTRALAQAQTPGGLTICATIHRIFHGAMGSYLSSPNGDQDIEHGAGAGLSFGVCNVQGWRRNQEDAHIAAPAFDEERGVSLFAVFDGHGGAEVALYCEANFGRALRGTRAYADGDYAVALRDAFLRIDDMLRTEEGFAEVCRLKLDHDAKQASINDAHAARTAGKNGESRGDFQSIDIASLISKGGAEDGGDNSKSERDAAAAAMDEGQDGEEFISVGNGIRISRSSFERFCRPRSERKWMLSEILWTMTARRRRG